MVGIGYTETRFLAGILVFAEIPVLVDVLTFQFQVIRTGSFQPESRSKYQYLNVCCTVYPPERKTLTRLNVIKTRFSHKTEMNDRTGTRMNK